MGKITIRKNLFCLPWTQTLLGTHRVQTVTAAAAPFRQNPQRNTAQAALAFTATCRMKDYSLQRQIVAGLIMLLLVTGGDAALAATCTPTPWDEIGPFYRPNAPVRNSIGKGYVLSGTVRSADDCRPLPNIRIEVWQVGPGGEYDADHRATLFSDQNGRYRLETSFPPPYVSRPSHIHILVDAKGFEGLITQHYPKKDSSGATFDLVIVPETESDVKKKNLFGR